MPVQISICSIICETLYGYSYSPPVLFTNEGVVASLRDDFMGGAQRAARAVDSVLHDIITFKTLHAPVCGIFDGLDYDILIQLNCLLCMFACRACLPSVLRLLVSAATPDRGGPLP